MPFSNLDTKDSGILKMLNEDSRATTQAIADALNMPRVTVHDRIKRLQERGVIDKFSVEMMALEDVVILRDLCNAHLNQMVKKVSITT